MAGAAAAAAAAAGQRKRRKKRRTATRTATARAGALALGLGLGLAGMQPVSAGTPAQHQFPYVPTQILMPTACVDGLACNDADLAYIFSQSDDGTVRFSALNYSGAVEAGAQLIPITTQLPFLTNSPASTAFGAARTSNGSLVVYAGACEGAGGSLWRYSNQPDSGDWVERRTTAPSTSLGQASSRGPPYFLGGTLAFSSRLTPTMDQPTIYTYGGMCAVPSAASPSSWQSGANYTKAMLSLAPNTQAADATYSLAVASTAGPRTPIAGFTLTQLPASMKNTSGTITQQTGFALLGGHTQHAFINMSTAAVWHLPEQAWSFINIGGPDAASPHEIDSRSGHTAVLTEDGSSIVILGGWVGDVNTPADPQLAILRLSEAYSSWKWVVPSAQPAGKGIYGHGAATLPGNVMMVLGGWQTNAPGGGGASAASSSMPKRQQASTGSSGLRFFNMTSMSWSDSYQNPAPGKLPRGGDARDAPALDNHPQSRRLGFGLGFGLGLGLLLCLLVFFLVWRCRLRKRRQSREEAAQAMAEDEQYFTHDTDDMVERDGADSWLGMGPDPYSAASTDGAMGYESLRGGARASLDDGHDHLVIPRKPVMSRAMRGGYAPAEIRTNTLVSASGRIHPIMEESDEEDQYPHGNAHLAEPLTPESVATDPFTTPTAIVPPPVTFPVSHRSSITPSPESHRHYDSDVQDWVSDVDAADSLLDRYSSSRQARMSPMRRNSARSGATRDDESRSGSNLSESNRSALDSLPRSPSNRRSAGGGLFGGMLLSSLDHPKSSGSSSSSYNTANSGFGALQAEGPALLGRTTPGQPGADDEDVNNAPPSPSKMKPRRGWLGSLRRVFSDTSGPPPALSVEESSPTGPKMELYGGDYEPQAGLRGELLRRKQGRQDWEDEAAQQQEEEEEKRQYLRESSSAQPDNEWDIEKAVEQRLVQVMFTVPKERLRVVNGGEEQDEDHDAETATTHSQLTKADGGELQEPQAAEFVGAESLSSGRPVEHQGSGLDEESRFSHVEDGELLHAEAIGPRLSAMTDDSGRRSSGALFTAEAVTFEKPRTRVLQMVDSIESRSQSNSPTRGMGDV